MTKKYLFELGGVTFEVTHKKMKTLRLRVCAAKALISAPLGASRASVERFAENNLDWTRRKLARQAESSRPLSQGFAFLGDSLAVEVVPPQPGLRGARLCGEKLVVYTADASGETVEKLCLKWLRASALEYFAERTKALLPLFPGAREPSVGVSVMRTRWGSCNTKTARINYSVWLAGAPRGLIDYVVAHELTHLLCPGHDARFYARLGAALPDHAARRRELAALGASLIRG